jgi:hypothetical protein
MSYKNIEKSIRSKKMLYRVGMSLEIILLALGFQSFASGHFLSIPLLLFSISYLLFAALIAYVLFRWRRLVGLFGPVFDRATLPSEETNPSLNKKTTRSTIPEIPEGAGVKRDEE